MAREARRTDMRCHHSAVAPYIYELASSCSIYIQPVEVPKDPPLQAGSVGASPKDNERERERMSAFWKMKKASLKKIKK